MLINSRTCASLDPVVAMRFLVPLIQQLRQLKKVTPFAGLDDV